MAVNWSIKRRYSFSDNLKKIIRFYLLECPIEGDSRRYLDQANLQVWQPDRLLRRMESTSKLNGATWKIVSLAEMNNRLQEMESLHKLNPKREIAIHSRAHNYNKPTALIHMIRCSFAHGGFSQRSCDGETYYVLENLHDGKIKGRAVLYEKTLLSWIKLIKEGPVSNGS